ncbi:MAG: hypothetical protein V4794_10030 [Pseudomonadota bacterium]
MITKSTPWSITWTEDESHTVTFMGEWTLEPKFYLVLPPKSCWDGSNTPIKSERLQGILARFAREAKERGWVVVLEEATGDWPNQQ